MSPGRKPASSARAHIVKVFAFAGADAELLDEAGGLAGEAAALLDDDAAVGVLAALPAVELPAAALLG